MHYLSKVRPPASELMDSSSNKGRGLPQQRGKARFRNLDPEQGPSWLQAWDFSRQKLSHE